MFWLAGHIGGMTVSEIPHRMPHSEFVEWIAYYNLNPLGEFPWKRTQFITQTRGDLLKSQICMAIDDMPIEQPPEKPEDKKQ